MNIISTLLGNILNFIFGLVHNYGLAIILFTIFVKLCLLPLTIKQTKSTKAMQDIQPKLQEIQRQTRKTTTRNNESI